MIHVPGLANVQDVDTVGAGLPQVRLHVHLHVLAAEVALGGQEHLHVLGGGVERRGKVLGGHLDCRCVERVLATLVFEMVGENT